jgi:cytochrome c peroxidase
MQRKLIFGGLALAAVVVAQSGGAYGSAQVWWDSGERISFPWQEEYNNPEGSVGVLNQNGMVRTQDHAFFEALGTNGRACITCHQPSNGMSISTITLAERWKQTEGKDPIFAAFDGSNCPDLPQAEMGSHSLLLERGLFRIPLQWPPRGVTPEFRLEVVSDPAGCNKPGTVSVYRRPRVAANLKYIGTLMADGREATLESQAISAAFGHEQATAHPTVDQLRQIVAFEKQLFVAQITDIRAGLLEEGGGPALLGPENVATGKPLNARISFTSWKNPEDERVTGLQREFRQSVARGSEVFFENCARCHHEGMATAPLNIGTTDVNGPSPLPVFRITCGDRKIETHDPGRALITGKCADVGAIVMQQFRGLAARAPYFSNGSAKTLEEVVGFYEKRYQMDFTAQQKQDLVNFLKVL